MPGLLPALLPVPPAASTGAVLPDDRPSAHASGSDPYRVLLVGAAAHVHEGVRCHDLSLAGWLARALGERTGHGVDVDVVVLPPTGSLRPDAPIARPLEWLDAVVLVLGVVPRLRRGQWEWVRALLDTLRADLPQASLVLVTGAPASDRATAHRNDESGALALFAASAGAVGAEVAALPRVSTQRPSERFAVWGEVLADELASRLPPPIASTAATRVVDEARRQDAVDRLPPLGDAWATEFRRIVGLVRAAYGARFAALSMLDGDRTRFVVRSGFDSLDELRGETLCTEVVHTASGLVVGDASVDPRFAGRRPVLAGGVRFYAGYPVGSVEGEPVGVLCVFDPMPRTVAPADLAVLRDFASEAQRALWRLTRAPAGGDPYPERKERAWTWNR